MHMIDRFFGKKNSTTTDERLRAIEGSDTADLAAKLLRAPSALMRLSHDEARVVVSYMQPELIQDGTAFIKEGDTRNTGFMVLTLDGEVIVETIVVSRVHPITVTVLGAGSLLGEMGLLDGEPRSASCIAGTDVRCAILSRESLQELMNDNPPVAAKFMMAVSLRIAERLRETADKLKMYAQLTQAMQEEIDHLLPT